MSFRNNKEIKNYKAIISKNLLKYNKTKEQLSQNIIKQLIFHKKSHYTSLFIEYLIWDDFQEFLTKYYTNKICYKKLIHESKNNYNLALADDIGYRIIFQNFQKKKLLQKNNISKQNQSKNINIAHFEKNLNKNNFFHILPLDESGEKKIFEIERKNTKNESETIDNINANNDISISLDLKINKNYDSKILDKNSAFVKGKNGENDKEIMKVIKFLKPIHDENIDKTSKLNKIKNRNTVFCYEYLNDISRNKTKYISHSNNNSEKKRQKKVIENNNIKNNYNNKKRLKCNSLNNNNNAIKNKDSISYKNIFKIDIKKNSPSPDINKNKSKMRKSKNNRNIILVNKFINNTTSTKTNSKSNETFNANNSKNKINNNIKKSNQTKTQNNKISNLNTNLPFSSKIREKKVLNSNSNSKKNLKNNDGKIKKIILDKKIISTNFTRKEKYINKKYNFVSPEIHRKNYFNTKKNFNENKLLIDKIIYKKKEKSFDNKHSIKDNASKNSSKKLSPVKCKKIL